MMIFDFSLFSHGLQTANPLVIRHEALQILTRPHLRTYVSDIPVRNDMATLKLSERQDVEKSQ